MKFGFEDFLQRENLRVDVKRSLAEQAIIFDDIKYNINYNHDANFSLDKEYDSIYKKYTRRIERFKGSLAAGHVLFFRLILDNEELRYIIEHAQYVEEIIKSSNVSNQIIYLVTDNVSVVGDVPFIWYKVHLYGHGSMHEQGRALFDTNPELMAYCTANIDPEVQRLNAAINMEHEGVGKELDNMRMELRRQVIKTKQVIQLLNIDFDKVKLPETMVFYGLGDTSRAVYEKIKQRGKIRCFVDKSPTVKEYKNIPVFALIDYKANVGETVVVFPSWGLQAIKRELRSHVECDIRIVSAEKLFYVV